MVVQMSSIIVAIAIRKISRGNKKRQHKFKSLFFFWNNDFVYGHVSSGAWWTHDDSLEIDF